MDGELRFTAEAEVFGCVGAAEAEDLAQLVGRDVVDCARGVARGIRAASQGDAGGGERAQRSQRTGSGTAQNKVTLWIVSGILVGRLHRVAWSCLACAAATLAAVACTTPDTPAAGENARVAIDADSLPAIAAREVLRVGSATDDTAGFSNVTSVAVDADSNVYVYDRGARSIRVFATDGRHVRAIGSAGSGPGEFSAYPHVIGVRGDTVWTFDRSSARLNVFRRDGTVIATGHVAPGIAQLHEGYTALIEPLSLSDSGRLISHAEVIAGRNIAEARPATDTVRVPRVRYALTGGVVDTGGVETFPPLGPAYMPVRTRRVSVGDAQFTVPSPPGDEPLNASFPDGNVRVDAHRASSERGATFLVTRFRLDGAIAHQLTFRYAPGRYEGAVLDTIAMRPVVRSPRGSDAAFRAVRAALEFPEFQAPAYRLFAAEDGAVWIRREDNAGADHRWIVVEWNGDVRGEVRLVRSAVPMWAAGSIVWAIDTDAAGVPWLVRYRLESHLPGTE